MLRVKKYIKKDPIKNRIKTRYFIDGSMEYCNNLDELDENSDIEKDELNRFRLDFTKMLLSNNYAYFVVYEWNETYEDYIFVSYKIVKLDDIIEILIGEANASY